METKAHVTRRLSASRIDAGCTARIQCARFMVFSISNNVTPAQQQFCIFLTRGRVALPRVRVLQLHRLFLVVVAESDVALLPQRTQRPQRGGRQGHENTSKSRFKCLKYRRLSCSHGIYAILTNQRWPIFWGGSACFGRLRGRSPRSRVRACACALWLGSSSCRRSLGFIIAPPCFHAAAP